MCTRHANYLQGRGSPFSSEGSLKLSKLALYCAGELCARAVPKSDLLLLGATPETSQQSLM